MASFKSRIIRLLKNIVEKAERTEQQQADKKSTSEKARAKSLTERLSADHKSTLESEEQPSHSPGPAPAQSHSPQMSIPALPPSSLSKISTCPGNSSQNTSQSTSQTLSPSGADLAAASRSGIQSELSFDHKGFLARPNGSSAQTSQGGCDTTESSALSNSKKKTRDQARLSHSLDFLPETQLYTGSSEYEETGMAEQWKCTTDLLTSDDSRETEATFRNAAANNSTSPAQLAWLATLVSPEVRVSVAGNAKTPAETLRKLANDADNNVRLAVATNPATPIDVLRNLVRDSSKAVSIEAETALAAKGDLSAVEKKSHELLANNRFNSTSNSLVASYTTLDALKIEATNPVDNSLGGSNAQAMAAPPGITASGDSWRALTTDTAQKAYIQQKDTVKDLKFNAPALNGPKKQVMPTVSLETPEGAAPEEILAFHRMLATKLSTPPTKLAELAAHENMEVRAAVAENVSTPAEGFQILAEDKHSQVKLRVLDNSSCPMSIIETLCNDSDPYVAYEAKNQLKRLNTSANAPRSNSERFL
jgi:hypothetical protein